MTKQNTISDEKFKQQMAILAGEDAANADPELKAKMEALRAVLLKHKETFLASPTEKIATAPSFLQHTSSLLDTLGNAISNALSPPVFATVSALVISISIAFVTIPTDTPEEITAKNNVELGDIFTPQPKQAAKQTQIFLQTFNIQANVEQNTQGEWQVIGQDLNSEQVKQLRMYLAQQYPTFNALGSMPTEKYNTVITFSNWNYKYYNDVKEGLSLLIERFTEKGATVTQYPQIEADVWQLKIVLPETRSESLQDMMQLYELQEFPKGELQIKILPQS